MATRALYKIWQLVPYTKYGNSCPIQNMATHAVYKIWQLVSYTKYGNSCPIQNMETHAKIPHHG